MEDVKNFKMRFEWIDVKGLQYDRKVEYFY